MIWALVSLLGLSALSMLGFIAGDAKQAYDSDPNTHTVSMYIKRWRRRSRWHTWLLSVAILNLFLVPTYLFLHLVRELI